MNKKNILMLLDAQFPYDERVEKEALKLITNGFKVSILALKNDKTETYFVHKGIEVHQSSITKTMRNKLVPFLPIIPIYISMWMKELKNFSRGRKFDILHTHDLPMASIGYHYKEKYPQVNLVCDLHENYPSLVSMENYMKRPFYRYFFRTSFWYRKEKKWLSNANLIFCTANGMKDRIQKLGTTTENIQVLENTIDINEVEIHDGFDQKLREDDIILIYTGGITQNRGLDTAILGFQKAKQKFPNLKFWIVGRGSEQKDLEKLIANNEIHDIKFFGFMPHNVMFKLIQQATITVIPHVKYEHTDNTSPNKIFHYWYLSKPVITSNCNFLKSIVAKANGGKVFESRNVNDFSDKLKEMISDTYEDYGKKGKEYVLKKGNWDFTSLELIKSYKQLDV